MHSCECHVKITDTHMDDKKRFCLFCNITSCVFFLHFFFVVTLDPISTHAQLSEEWKKKFFHLLLSMKFNIISVEQNELFWNAGMGNSWRNKFVVLKIMFKELLVVHRIGWIKMNSVIGQKLDLTTSFSLKLLNFRGGTQGVVSCYTPIPY